MTLKLWDAATGRLLQGFPAHAVVSLAFSRDGTLAATGGANEVVDGKIISGIVRIWDLRTGGLLRTLPPVRKAIGVFVTSVAFSPDGTRVLSVNGAPGGKTAPEDITLWDLASARIVQHWPGQKVLRSRIEFLPSGDRLAIGSDHDVRIYNVESGRLVRSLPVTSFSGLAFCSQGKLALSADPATIWDTDTGQVIRNLGANDSEFYQEFSLNGRNIVASGNGNPGAIYVWDATTGQLVRSSRAPKDAGWTSVSRDGTRAILGMPPDFTSSQVRDLLDDRPISTIRTPDNPDATALSPDYTRVLFGSAKAMILSDAANGKLLKSFAHSSPVSAVAFSPNGARVASGDRNGNVRLWDVSSGQALWTYSLTNKSLRSIRFSPDGRQILITAFEDKTPRLLDAATGTLIQTFDGHTAIASSAAFSFDGTRVLTGGQDRTARLWDAVTSNLLRTFKLPDSDTPNVSFSPDGHRAIFDNQVWNIDTGELLVRFFATPEGEWLTITPEGFFAGSQNAAGMLSVVRGLEVWSIDQLYQSLYRPDLVREKLANDPRGLVREAASNLDLNRVIASGSAPDVHLTVPGRSLGQAAVNGNSATVQAEIIDRGGGVGRIEWRVNGVSIAIDTHPGAVSPIKLTRSVALDVGDNAIEVTAYNSANLIASAPGHVSVAAQPLPPLVVPSQQPTAGAPPEPTEVAATKPKLFVLVAGVNNYAEKRIQQLSFAVSDAKDVARGFNEAAGSLYQSVEVKLMTDADVTRDKLDAAFAVMANKASASDVLILYLAGHGKTVDGRYYFIPQDFTINGEITAKNINASVKAKAIGQEEWQGWLASIPARKSVVLFDTCESGTLAGDETQQLEKGAANDRLAQATGRSILTAAGGSEEALEGYHGHGLFTYEVLDAINQADGDRSGTVEVNELAAYVYAQVSELSQKVFSQRQVPQMRITASYPLTKQMRILTEETIPVSEIKPSYQLEQSARLQIMPGLGATVVRSLAAKTAMTVLGSKDGWSLVANQGKPIGYVATRYLLPAK
jgi:WD40 repeat protein/uncharacterized caspase-like protein